MFFNHKIELSGNTYTIDEFTHVSFQTDIPENQWGKTFVARDISKIYSLARYNTNHFLVINLNIDTNPSLPDYKLYVRNAFNLGQMNQPPGPDQFGPMIFENEFSLFYNNPTSKLLRW